jgi:hypothetical protein
MLGARSGAHQQQGYEGAGARESVVLNGCGDSALLPASFWTTDGRTLLWSAMTSRPPGPQAALGMASVGQARNA